jgi:hypothetical protein
MVAPDFACYSLALIKDETIIYTSDESGLRPLVRCILELAGKVSGCILHDKVIGLAAARLALYSGMIDEIVAGTISEPARARLAAIDFPFTASATVPMILNRDRTGICPMEAIALSTPDDIAMWRKMLEKLGIGAD